MKAQIFQLHFGCATGEQIMLRRISLEGARGQCPAHHTSALKSLDLERTNSLYTNYMVIKLNVIIIFENYASTRFCFFKIILWNE